MINPISNWDEIKSGGFERLPAGGYVAVIKNVEAKGTEEKPFLEITFDIARGQYKDFYKDEDADHAYTHQFRQYFSEKALGAFKGFLKDVDEANGTAFNEAMKTSGLDENKLCGKLIGIVVGYEEYEKTNGSVGLRSSINTKSVKAIEDGKFTTPELKKLPASNSDMPPAGAVMEGFDPFEGVF